MEGVANEACSLAGHWGLRKLIAFYDDNHISIDGDTEITFIENVDERFKGIGWHVIWVKNGNTSYDEIRAAIKEATAVKDKPTLIKVTTTIGYGSPNKDLSLTRQEVSRIFDLSGVVVREVRQCELYGVRMPELRSGARRSKRLGDLEPPPQPVVQEENWELSAQNRTRRVGGRGRGNVVVDEGPSPAVPATARLRAAGRGRGARLAGLDPELCRVLPEAAPLAAAEPVFNRAVVVANKDIAMEGGSADKLVGVEEEAITTPIPDLVQVGDSPTYKIDRKLG